MVMAAPHRASGNGAVEQAFVYSVALNAGSVVVSITQRRNQTETDGPLSRIPAVGTLVDVTSFLTPPQSPVVPQRVFVLVVGPQSQPSDIVVRIGMNRGVGGGWFDVEPYPNPAIVSPASATPVVDIGTVTTQLDIDINDASPLPGDAASLSGLDVPAMMVWNKAFPLRIQHGVDIGFSRSGKTTGLCLNSGNGAGPHWVRPPMPKVSSYLKMRMAELAQP